MAGPELLNNADSLLQVLTGLVRMTHIAGQKEVFFLQTGRLQGGLNITGTGHRFGTGAVVSQGTDTRQAVDNGKGDQYGKADREFFANRKVSEKPGKRKHNCVLGVYGFMCS